VEEEFQGFGIVGFNGDLAEAVVEWRKVGVGGILNVYCKLKTGDEVFGEAAAAVSGDDKFIAAETADDIGIAKGVLKYAAHVLKVL
jgi:hypothetical protein